MIFVAYLTNPVWTEKPVEMAGFFRDEKHFGSFSKSEAARPCYRSGGFMVLKTRPALPEEVAGIPAWLRG